MKKIIDARNEVCPIPVVKAKNALAELGDNDGVEIYVDNEIAVQNLEKLAKQKGYYIYVADYGENEYAVTLMKSEINASETTSCSINQKSDTVVVIASSKMGEGDEVLGTLLMKSFLYALANQDSVPSAILFYNSGVKLCVLGSECLEDLHELENAGSRIMACGTCLNHYNLTDKLAIGSIANMYTIVEEQMKAGKVIRP